jgi:DNA-binding NarL/FixJ family response regulator
LTAAGAVRVLVADDHLVVRAGLRALLGIHDGIALVGEAGDGAEAVELARELRPDVVLMDLVMPVEDGVSATARIRAELPGTNVLVLTTYDTDADIFRALAAGAVGYLLKDVGGADLAAAIRAAARGESVLTPSVAARVVGRMRAPAEEALSARELDVLGLAAEGAANREIARALHISEATVKTHLLRVYAKLGVNDRTAAVTAALAKGILRLRG